MSALLLLLGLAAQFDQDFGFTPQAEAKIVQAAFAETEVAQDETVELRFTLEITEGWHVYHPDQNPADGIPVSVAIEGEDYRLAGELVSLQEPEPHVVEAGNWRAEYLWLSDKPEFTVPVQVLGEVGAREVVVTVSYQVCNDSTCLNLTTTSTTVPLTVVEGDLSAAAAAGGAAVGTVQDVAELELDREDFLAGKVQVDLELEGELVQGEEVGIVVSMAIEDGWHVYHPDQDPLDGVPVYAVVDPAMFELVEPLTTTAEPKAVVERVGTVKATYLWLEGDQEFRGRLRVVGDPSAGSKLLVRWQTCNENTCLTPEQQSFAMGGFSGAGGLPSGFWAFLVAAISAGLLTLLTPCVFPMIPVTISYFTKRAEAGKGSPLGNALAYSGGIVFTFAGIGVGAAVIIGPTAANALGANPWVNMAIGLLFVAMAISLLGFYEIRPPQFLQRFASKASAGGQQKGGYLPVVLMAVAFTITAFTCTVGFVGAVFAAGLQLGVGYLMAGMLVYGLVFALPFFFLSLFPAKLQSLPNAGGWMNTVKVCAGFVELAAAVKFFSNTDLVWEWEVLTWPVFLGLWVVIALAWAAYMFGLYKLPHDLEKPKPGKGRLVFAAVLTGFGVWMVPGIFDRGRDMGGMVAYLPPSHYGAHHVDEETGLVLGPADLEWYEEYERAFKEAKAAGLPLFMDFTGATCVNCRLMENGVFPDPEVKSRLERFTRVALWVDKNPAYAQMEVERFQTASQPFYVLLDPRSDQVLATFPGYDPDPAKFAAFLQGGLDAFERTEP
jgi:thiol:disulfide interchange protein/DsbC/DsbD-like thiol-disulfide interchange protein